MKIAGIVTLGIIAIAGGMYFSFWNHDSRTTTTDTTLLSQSVTNNTMSPEPTMSKEKITQRIGQIQSEILKVTNDPDRDLELRGELYTLQQELKTAK